MDREGEAEMQEFFNEDLLLAFADEAAVTGEWSIEPLGLGHHALVKLDGIIMGRGEAPSAQVALDRATVVAIEEYQRAARGDELVLELADVAR